MTDSKITFRTNIDHQVMLLEPDARLLLMGSFVDLTSSGERLVVPFHLDYENKWSPPTTDDIADIAFVDRRTDAGATFSLLHTTDGLAAELDITGEPESFDEHTATVQRLTASFTQTGWTSRHENSAQVQWAQYPDLQPGFHGHIGWSVVWSREACELILRDLGEHCDVPAVDIYVPGKTGYDGVIWSWQEMVVVPNGSRDTVSELIRSHPTCSFELTVTGTGWSEHFLEREPPPIPGWA